MTRTTINGAEREQAETALRATEGRYRTLFEYAPDGILIADAQSNYIDANPSMCRMLGYTRDEVIGLHASDIVAPSEVQYIAPALTHINASTDYNREWRFRRQDGSTFDAEVIVTKIPDGNLLAMVRDITTHKLAEAELQASEARFRQQYNGFPLPTYSWLQDGDDFVLQDFNDAAKAVTDLTSSVGVRASVALVAQPEILANLYACMAGQHGVEKQEIRVRNPASGRERDLSVNFVFVPPRTVMVHTEDITERLQGEQQREALAQSEKLRALGQMASGIAHDINQSLMLVASYSDLARRALGQDPPNLTDLEDLLMTATQAALDGGETVKRLLLFTRPVTERAREIVDLCQLVRGAAQMTAPRWRDAAQAEGCHISLLVETDGQPTIRGSSAQLRELMTNIIFNAVDALPDGGLIQVRVHSDAGLAIIEVTDSGVGMSAEVQDRVFEPFFTTKGGSGTGLGLAMVFGIVEQHEGHIEVRSAPGAGTTFRIAFPLVDASADEGSLYSPLKLQGPLHSLRILVVDDEPMMTRAVMRMLRPVGHEVTTAGSAEEALERLEAQPFDVVVSDLGMGAGMNGWDLAEAVRRRWPSVRFMLATGWGAAIDPSEAERKGVEAVLAKPYQAADLLLALNRSLPRG